MTDRDLRQQIHAAIDAGGFADGYDIDGITEEIIGHFGVVDIGSIDSVKFWDIVAKYDNGNK